MKIVIPVFQDRISPRLDCTQSFMLVEVKDGKILSKQKFNETWSNPFVIMEKILSLKPDLIICGAIDRFTEESFLQHNIRIISWVVGEVDDILNLFLKRKLFSGFVPNIPQKCKRWQRKRRFGRRNFFINLKKLRR